jgi:hypothetical protein
MNQACAQYQSRLYNALINSFVNKTSPEGRHPSGTMWDHGGQSRSAYPVSVTTPNRDTLSAPLLFRRIARIWRRLFPETAPSLPAHDVLSGMSSVVIASVARTESYALELKIVTNGSGKGATASLSRGVLCCSFERGSVSDLLSQPLALPVPGAPFKNVKKPGMHHGPPGRKGRGMFMKPRQDCRCTS